MKRVGNGLLAIFIPKISLLTKMVKLGLSQSTRFPFKKITTKHTEAKEFFPHMLGIYIYI